MFYTFTKRWLNTVKDKAGDKFQDLTTAAGKVYLEFFLVRMRENMDQKNSEYGHFSRSAGFRYLSQVSLNNNLCDWNIIEEGFKYCFTISLVFVFYTDIKLQQSAQLSSYIFSKECLEVIKHSQRHSITLRKRNQLFLFFQRWSESHNRTEIFPDNSFCSSSILYQGQVNYFFYLLVAYCTAKTNMTEFWFYTARFNHLVLHLLPIT